MSRRRLALQPVFFPVLFSSGSFRAWMYVRDDGSDGIPDDEFPVATRMQLLDDERI